MKKLYSLALAALAGSATVFAANPVLKAEISNAEIKKAEINKAELTVATRTATVATSPRKAASSVAKAPDYEALTWTFLGEGQYASSVVADTYAGSNDRVNVEVYESNENEGVYKLVGVWPDILGIDYAELIVDASNPEYVMVPIQSTGIVDNVDGETFIASQTYLFTEEQGYPADVVIDQLPEIVPVLEDGVIVFPARSLALNWPDAPLDSKYETEADKWYTGKSDGLLILPGAEYVEPWTFLGVGVFTDNSFAPTFGATVEPYEVEVYQGTTETHLYKVLNPWKGCYEALGFNSESPEIELDATDPDNVILPMTLTGIQGGSDGKYYILNDGYLSELNGEAPEGYTTLTITEDAYTFTFNPSSLYLYAATSQKIYYCGRNTTSTIVIPVEKPGVSGVNDVVVGANAPVEYFNLQGVRIDNPAAGQVVIKRQGTAVSKFFVR